MGEQEGGGTTTRRFGEAGIPAEGAETSATTTAEKVDRYDAFALEWRVRKFAIYNHARAEFLENLHTRLLFAVVLFGSGAVLRIIPECLIEYLAAASALAAAIDLIYAPYQKAAAHNGVYNKAMDLLGDVEGKTNYPRVEFQEAEDRLRAIQKDCPAPYYAALDLLGYNQCVDHYGTGVKTSLGWLVRTFRNVFTFSSRYFMDEVNK